MKLSELLDDAPPAGFDVDDAVRAGKRLRFRRRAGVVIAAVVAVAAAIGVPQALSRRAAEPLPATPSAPSAVTYTYRGYTAGAFRVADPSRWRLSDESSVIFQGQSVTGRLSVYRPGVDPFGSLEVTPAAPVAGRPAYGPKSGPAMLAWTLPDDATAVLAGGPAMTERDLRQVAEAFKAAPAYAVTIPFTASSVPKGFRVVSIESAAADTTSVTLAPDATYQEMMARPDRRCVSGAKGRRDRMVRGQRPGDRRRSA